MLYDRLGTKQSWTSCKSFISYLLCNPIPAKKHPCASYNLNDNIFFIQPYDFLSLIPVIEGAGGVVTDWKGHELFWEASPNSQAASKRTFGDDILFLLIFFFFFFIICLIIIALVNSVINFWEVDLYAVK